MKTILGIVLALVAVLGTAAVVVWPDEEECIQAVKEEIEFRAATRPFFDDSEFYYGRMAVKEQLGWPCRGQDSEEMRKIVLGPINSKMYEVQVKNFDFDQGGYEGIPQPSAEESIYE